MTTDTAAFGQAPKMGQAILTAAKTNPFSGSTNAVLLFTAGASGSIVNGIGAIPRDTFTGGVICIFYSADAGTTLNLLSVGSLAAYTYGATTLPGTVSFSHPNGSTITLANPLYVPASMTLYASSTVALANGILVTANGVDL